MQFIFKFKCLWTQSYSKLPDPLALKISLATSQQCFLSFRTGSYIADVSIETKLHNTTQRLVIIFCSGFHTLQREALLMWDKDHTYQARPCTRMGNYFLSINQTINEILYVETVVSSQPRNLFLLNLMKNKCHELKKKLTF